MRGIRIGLHHYLLIAISYFLISTFIKFPFLEYQKSQDNSETIYHDQPHPFAGARNESSEWKYVLDTSTEQYSFRMCRTSKILSLNS